MQKFEVRRTAGIYPLAEAKQKFDEFGIIVLKQFMATQTRDDIRDILTRKLERSRSNGAVLKLPQYPKADFLLGDILANRDLAKYDYVFFKNEVVDLLKHLLHSKELVYYGDSSTQFDAAVRGFHKDHVERYNANTDDWVGDYGIIRCAFYCEDHSKYSGGLKVRLASQNVENCRSSSDTNKISIHMGKAVDVKSEYGDLVMWSMRLTHSGNYRKLKFFPGLCLHPRIEMMLPDFLAAPEQMRRYFMSCAFARPGSHLEHYIKNMLRRDDDYRQYLERARNPLEVQGFLEERGLTFRKPCDYYAQLDSSD